MNKEIQSIYIFNYIKRKLLITNTKYGKLLKIIRNAH